MYDGEHGRRVIEEAKKCLLCLNLSAILIVIVIVCSGKFQHDMDFNRIPSTDMEHVVIAGTIALAGQCRR